MSAREQNQALLQMVATAYLLLFRSGGRKFCCHLWSRKGRFLVYTRSCQELLAKVPKVGIMQKVLPEVPKEHGLSFFVGSVYLSDSHVDTQ
jgi:hypothetical protein